MRTRGLVVLLLFAASIAGCAAPGGVALHPVDNQIPPLRSGVRDIETVDVPPVPASDVRPSYPAELFTSGVNGTAVVLFTVRADGAVTDVSVIKSEDIHFGNAAIESVLRWRFVPARVDGAPVACGMSSPFVFSSPGAKLILNPRRLGQTRLFHLKPNFQVEGADNHTFVTDSLAKRNSIFPKRCQLCRINYRSRRLPQAWLLRGRSRAFVGAAH